jgi:tripeptide aminopeptidase
MEEIIKKQPECKKLIVGIYEKLGLHYEFEATRGGTDGATFSYLGCPCPNLGTGSYNHHGRYEFAVVEEMELMSKIISKIYIK